MRVQAAAAAVSAAILLVVAQVAGQSQPPLPQQPPPLTQPPAPLIPGPLDETKKCRDLVPPGTYTAQTKARIAVMPFLNTNEAAEKQKFGSAVSAMLVTFLKRKSQFVVVERDQKTLERIAEELNRVGSGATEQSTGAPVELAAFDALLQGQVTLLGEGANQRIEVDARLLGMDAKIVSVSNKGGTLNDLRSVVERLGIDLEQGFLRPYYGSLTVTIPDPLKVRVFLTPILWECAKPDEKPPIELDRAKPQRDDAGYKKWVTEPNVATITNLLGGWYTIRFDRPGYDGIGPNSAENGRLEIIGNYGDPRPMTRVGGELREPSAQQKRFIVHIRPLESVKWPAEGMVDPLVKRGGSVKIMVKREFLDNDYRDASEIPGLTTVIESRNLALNDERDLLPEGPDGTVARPEARPAGSIPESRSCGVYAFNQVKSGQVVIKDYHGPQRPADTRLPIGSYEASVWAPQYTVARAEFEVQNQVMDQAIMIDLKRALGSLRVQRTGDPSPNYKMFVEGEQTKFTRAVPLNFEMDKGVYLIRGLPLDTYTIYSDLPGFKNWKMPVRLLESDSSQRLKVGDQNCDVARTADQVISLPPDPNWVYLLKAQPWLAGRLEPGGMRSFVNPNLRDRPETTALLDAAIQTEEMEARRTDKRAGAKMQESALLVAPAKTQAAMDLEDPFQNLRHWLAWVDLLYLTDADTKRLAALPKVAGIIREYIDNGGGVFALVSSSANYTNLFGAAIPIDSEPVLREEVEVRPGSQPGLQIDLKIDGKVKKSFPVVQATKNQPLTDWRVLAYRRKGQKEPVVLERGDPERGGYVLVWIDTLANLEHDAAKEALLAAEMRALAWSQHLMFRRFGPDSSEARTARDRMNTLVFSVRKEVKGN